MKITTISKVASLVISSVMIQTTVAGHAVGIGVGPHFGGGDFGGGIFEMFFEQTQDANNQTDRGNTSRGHSCSARRDHHRSTPFLFAGVFIFAGDTNFSIAIQSSRTMYRSSDTIVRSNSICLDRADARPARHLVPIAERMT